MLADIEDKITFGRYKEKYVYEVLDINPTYLEWLITKTDKTNFGHYLTYIIKKKANQYRMDSNPYDYIGFPDIH